MSATRQRIDTEEVVRIGKEIYREKVLPTLTPEDDDKFVAIDIATGEFEIAWLEYDAIAQLKSRTSARNIFLERVGKKGISMRRLGLRPRFRGAIAVDL